MIKEILIVDGYNMIGAWSVLRDAAQRDLEEARDRLIELLAEYQGFTGRRVILVFDAHQVPGLGAKLRQSKVEVIYTKEKETADECIERLVTQMITNRRVRIFVATSDMVEQHVIFGKGAFRIPARELWLQLQENRLRIRKRIEHDSASRRNTFDHHIDQQLREKLEKWRRGK